MLEARDSTITGSEGGPHPLLDDSVLSPVLARPGQFKRGMVRRLLRQQSARTFAILAISEIGLLLLAPWLAARVRFHADPAALDAALADLTLTAPAFAIVIWLAMVTVGLYQRHNQELRGTAVGTFTRLLLSMVAGSVALMVIYFTLPELELGRGTFGLAIASAFTLLVASRLIFSTLVGGNGLRRRVLLLGSGSKADALMAEARARQEFGGIRIVKTISPGVLSKLPAGRQERQLHPESLLDLAVELGVDDIVVASDDLRNSLSMDDLMSCRLAGIEVLRLDAFYERELGRVMLESLLPSWFVFTDHFNRSVMRRFSKRVFDLVTATAVTLAALPFMLLVALAIWLESGGRGGVLYSQERVGEGNTVFRLYKFRSMRPDAESDGVARWASAEDDRITRVGRIIRKLRLDELPQLYNVFIGDMSMVGPRPERPQIVADLERRIPYYGLRHSIRPGLTGWAQLRYPYGASVADAVEKLRYDLFYIKEQSLLFDLQVLLQTVEVVLFRRGSR